MDIETTLRNALLDAVQAHEDAAPRLEEEQMRLETELAVVKSKLDSANSTLQRARDFPVKRGGDYVCPVCWVEGDTSLLVPTPGTEEEDYFRCRNCGCEWSGTA